MVERRLGMAEALGSKQKLELILAINENPSPSIQAFSRKLEQKGKFTKNIIMDQ